VVGPLVGPFCEGLSSACGGKNIFLKGRIYHAGCASSLYKRVEAESKKKMPMMTSSDELWPAQKLFSHFLWTWWMALVILRCSRRRRGERIGHDEHLPKSQERLFKMEERKKKRASVSLSDAFSRRVVMDGDLPRQRHTHTTWSCLTKHSGHSLNFSCS
jgi:hypothetical protein